MLSRFSLNKVLGTKVITALQRRNRSLWTPNNTVRSPCEDITIPSTSLVDYVWQNLEKWPERTATVCGVTNRSYTYRQLHKQSRTFAAILRKSFGIQDGDVVAIMLPNMPEYPTAVLGVLDAGGVATTINPTYTAYEVQRQLILSKTKLVITTPQIVPLMKEAFSMIKKEVPIITVTGNTPEGAVSFSGIVEAKNIDIDILRDVRRETNDVCLQPYSSGTTGLPKGVELTNRNMVANCEQQNTDELKHYNHTTETAQQSTLVVLPMFHSFALSIVMLHKLSAGLRLVTLPGFQPETFLNAMLKYNINLLYAAPPIVLFLGSHPQVTSHHFEHLQTLMSGAAPLPASDIERVFDKAGRQLNFLQGYGLTETSPLATISPPGSSNYSSVGYALPNVELRVVDQELNNLGPDKEGELLIKGPNVMKGYSDNPEATKEVFVNGGWFRSGDLAKIDEDGAVYITDRLKELIKVKGFQVPPAELEALLKEHPDVLDAAVVGVPDERSGEIPKAFITVRTGHKIDERSVVEFVSKRVAAYKRIKDIVVIDSIPKNPSGKILRRVIKEKYC